MTTLNDLKPGDEACVVKCLGDGRVFQRLCEMGFVQGVSVRFVRQAPFGDPVEVELNDCHLSLRRAEAAMIEVKPVEGAP